MRIFCQQSEPNHWLAWAEDHPETAFRAKTPMRAVLRLVRATPGLSINHLVPDNECTRDGLLCYVVGDVCPDCHGSGKYTGLNLIGDCETCDGSGRIGGFAEDSVPF